MRTLPELLHQSSFFTTVHGAVRNLVIGFFIAAIMTKVRQMLLHAFELLLLFASLQRLQSSRVTAAGWRWSRSPVWLCSSAGRGSCWACWLTSFSGNERREKKRKFATPAVLFGLLFYVTKRSPSRIHSQRSFDDSRERTCGLTVESFCTRRVVKYVHYKILLYQ